MLGRRRFLLRLRRRPGDPPSRRAMCTSALWTKLHRRRSTSRGDRTIRPISTPSRSEDLPLSISSLASTSKPVRTVENDSAAIEPVLGDLLSTMPQKVGLTPRPTAEVLEEVQLPVRPKRQIMMLQSVFEGRPPVLFFTYTVACGARQRPLDRLLLADVNGPKLYYSHTDAVHEYNAVVNTLRLGGLYRVRSDNRRWCILWSSHPPPELLHVMKPSQKTNHFPGSWHLGRKDLLWRNIARMQRRCGRVYSIMPQGYVLPKSFVAWEAARLKWPEALWIWKPCSQSCGRGIKIFTSSVSNEEAKDLGRKRGVIQRYVPNPLLIDGFKFDLRIYVVVLSYDPLKVYLNHEGLVRFATEKYSAAQDTLDLRTMHLTNYSVNKLSQAFVQNMDGKESRQVDDEDDDAVQVEEEQEVASKWCLTELKDWCARHDLEYDQLLERIKDIIIKSLIAVETPMRSEWGRAFDNVEAGWAARGASGAAPSTCFEMYGFDVLIDSDLKPWLLEVNICPSLSSGSPLDKRIKTTLVADSLTLAGVQVPPSLWRSNSSVKRTSSVMTGSCASSASAKSLCEPTPEELARRVARLAQASSEDALAFFDEAAWELVLDSHEEDMRCGGLTRIYPTANSAQYTSYFTEESYANLVLRKWYEAGGGRLFQADGPHPPPPPWVPRQVSGLRT